MAQHSCCKRADCQTSINAGLSLIFQASGNDEDDQCMGVGIVATRPISQGEQVFISYSGDTKIEDTWGKIFRCYCCQCQRSCVVRSGRSLKRTVPIAHQNTMTPQSGLPPKKARNEMYRPEKRKRDDQRAPDLEPPDKKTKSPSASGHTRWSEESLPIREAGWRVARGSQGGHRERPTPGNLGGR
jgi:hypothetical protein